jgi:hypothetical protein
LQRHPLRRSVLWLFIYSPDLAPHRNPIAAPEPV